MPLVPLDPKTGLPLKTLQKDDKVEPEKEEIKEVEKPKKKSTKK